MHGQHEYVLKTMSEKKPKFQKSMYSLGTCK
jgi:hypothetical protein